MVEVTVSITADADDGLDNNTIWDARTTNYSDGEFFRVSTTGANNLQGGLRFQSVNVPQGATINSATVTVRITNSNLSTLTIQGDDVDDAPAFSNSSRPRSGWTDTTASYTRTSLPTPPANTTLDVTGIVQEIVNRSTETTGGAGWAANNDMRFRLYTSDAGYAGLDIVDYDADTTGNEASLFIDYTASGGGIAVPTVYHHLQQMMRN